MVTGPLRRNTRCPAGVPLTSSMCKDSCGIRKYYYGFVNTVLKVRDCLLGQQVRLNCSLGHHEDCVCVARTTLAAVLYPELVPELAQSGFRTANVRGRRHADRSALHFPRRASRASSRTACRQPQFAARPETDTASPV